MGLQEDYISGKPLDKYYEDRGSLMPDKLCDFCSIKNPEHPHYIAVNNYSDRKTKISYIGDWLACDVCYVLYNSDSVMNLVDYVVHCYEKTNPLTFVEKFEIQRVLFGCYSLMKLARKTSSPDVGETSVNIPE